MVLAGFVDLYYCDLVIKDFPCYEGLTAILAPADALDCILVGASVYHGAVFVLAVGAYHKAGGLLIFFWVRGKPPISSAGSRVSNLANRGIRTHYPS